MIICTPLVFIVMIAGAFTGMREALVDFIVDFKGLWKYPQDFRFGKGYDL